MVRIYKVTSILAFSVFLATNTTAQQAPAPISLTLKRCLELALQNSKDIKVARIQASVADRAAMIGKADFLPNLYVGSGAGYTYGIPETPGGRAPSVFNVTYTEQVFNLPLRGAAKEQEEQAKAQKILLEDARSSVISGTAMGYLELVKVRHSLELLKKQNDSADRILGVTQERAKEGFELPMEVTRSQLTKAQVTQKTLQLEGREDELETYLRDQMGLAANQEFDLAADELPGAAEQEGANLVAMAMENNVDIRLAQSNVRAKEFRYKGEKGGYFPSLELVSTYSLLADYNNYSLYFNHFQKNNFNAGVQVQVPVFSARTKAAVGLADMNLQVAKATLENKKDQVSADVRKKTRHLREMDAAKEVARLQLQLAQQNVGTLQSQFEEGKTNLRDVERARLDESDRWMAYLDAAFQRQQAQLELLRTAGQLDKVLE
ncbi:MAG: TolC family protein [Acidobacteria bacterium]|nr:TolC family protein [Acidobacteriota bacterium]MBS1865309.1 TolC family protein [Acidobacteriota bacterium]